MALEEETTVIFALKPTLHTYVVASNLPTMTVPQDTDNVTIA